VIMSIGCFLIELCAFFFAVFALHRILAGGFDTHATSTVELIVRELEFEFVAVAVYFFTGTMLLMGPLGIRCFCMVQQGLRSDMLAASVMCLIVGVVMLILSFFNAHLQHFPFKSLDELLVRFAALSFRRCADGGRPALITVLAWALQLVSLVLAILSLIETLPWYYYREFYRDESVPEPEASSMVAALASAQEAQPGDAASGQMRSPPSHQSLATLSEEDESRDSPPWQAALNDPRFASAPSAALRQRSLARAASISSSVNSLDSLVVH